jgi:uncharacterized membrane protein YwzB
MAMKLKILMELQSEAIMIIEILLSLTLLIIYMYALNGLKFELLFKTNHIMEMRILFFGLAFILAVVTTKSIVYFIGLFQSF